MFLSRLFHTITIDSIHVIYSNIFQYTYNRITRTPLFHFFFFFTKLIHTQRKYLHQIFIDLKSPINNTTTNIHSESNREKRLFPWTNTWRQLPGNRVISSRCRVKDSSSARSFANEQKREGGCTDVGKSRKREGGEGCDSSRIGGRRCSWHPCLRRSL